MVCLGCNDSDPTVQALSDQIEFDRPVSPKADVQNVEITRF